MIHAGRAVVAGVVGLGVWAVAGCGLITAPVSVPGSIAANADFSLEGPVVDSRGAALEEVLLTQELRHQFWTPIAGYALTDEKKLRSVSGQVEVAERGEQLHLVFTHAGYHPAEYNFQADEGGIIMTPQGCWRAAPHFPVVLYPDKPEAFLRTWRGSINCADYPRVPSIDLQALAGAANVLVMRNAEAARDVEEVARDRSGLLYLTLTGQTPVPINSQGELDAQDVNLPAEITLHITGTKNGFVPIAPKYGYAPFQACDTAPTEGYAPTLTLSRARLKEMRGAPMNLIVEPAEYFFFRVDDHYGKGSIMWNRRVDGKSKEIAPAVFYFALFVHPRANDTNLTSFDTKVWR